MGETSGLVKPRVGGPPPWFFAIRRPAEAAPWPKY